MMTVLIFGVNYPFNAFHTSGLMDIMNFFRKDFPSSLFSKLKVLYINNFIIEFSFIINFLLL